MPTSTAPRLAAIIVSYNTATLTQKAIKSLFDSQGVRLQVWVVDNDSHDATVSKLQRHYHLTTCNLAQLPGMSQRLNRMTDLQFIRNVQSCVVGEHELYIVSLSDNLGFARANNLASSLADGEALFFLNTDATVDITTLAQMWKVLDRKQKKRSKQKIDRGYGLVAAQLRNVDGTVQRQGGSLPTLGRIFRWISFVDDIPGLRRLFSSYQAHDDEARAWAHQDTVTVGWAGGTALLVRRDCWDVLDGFDPAIFMYAEDIDLCWRAQKKGWKVGLVSAGNVVHLGSASGSSRQAVLGEIKGILYLWQKFHPTKMSWLKWIMRIGLWWRVIIFGILRQYGKQRLYQEALALVR